MTIVISCSSATISHKIDAFAYIMLRRVCMYVRFLFGVFDLLARIFDDDHLKSEMERKRAETYKEIV